MAVKVKYQDCMSKSNRPNYIWLPADIKLTDYALLYDKITEWTHSRLILDTINKTYPGLMSMLQGFQKCIA